MNVTQEFRLFEQAFDETATRLKGFRRFEQGRDVELFGDAVLACEIERAHHGGRVLALGDEEPDDRAGIDMLEDLRAHHELAPGGGLLKEEVGEIDLDRFRLARLLRQLGKRKAAKLAVFGFKAEVAIDNGTNLGGIDPEVDARGAKL